MNQRKKETTTTDRLPPHSPEAEQAVLGCCMLSPNECVARCIQDFKTAKEEAFYDLRHQTIYTTLVEMYDDRDPIDLITLIERLKVYSLLNQVGGIEYLSCLPDTVPTSANIDYYSAIVFEKYLLRRMIRVCIETVEKIYDYEGEIDNIMDEVERDVLSVNQLRVQQRTQTTRELVIQSVNEIERMASGNGEITGLATGFIDFDRLANGLNPAEMIVIAARPSMGKTSLAMNIAENVAVTNKIPVGVFSLEMTGTQLITRMLCSRARVNLRRIRDGFLADREIPKITYAASAVSGAPIYLDDSSGLSIMQLRAKARRMYQQYGIRLFVIDYLQLLNAMGSKTRYESRQQEITLISGGIKGLAKELNVPVIVLSQLNRQIERDKSRKPCLADLRESGSIEQDADFVGLLYRPSSGEDEDGTPDYSEVIPVNLLIGKQRNGPSGIDIELTFLKMFTRFESAARISDADVPRDTQQTMI